MDWTAWTGLRHEPELRSIYEWLDIQANYPNGKSSAVVGYVVAGSFGVAFMTGIFLLKALHTGMRSNPGLMLWPFLIAVVFSLVVCGLHYRNTSAAKKDHWRRIGGSRTFVWKLYAARWQGNLKSILGEEGALALNSAAYDFLRCQAALKSPSWRGLSSDSAWASARDKAEMAMEAAMSRLIVMVSQGGSPEKPEVQRLLDDMHQTTEEVVKTADRLAIQKGLAGDVSDELRQVLGEMQILNAAHDEVMNLSQHN